MNHYKYLDRYFFDFLRKLGKSENEIDCNAGIISAHGDKCYSYRDLWEKAGIPFEKGVAIYLLTYIKPYSLMVRETINGWVDPATWVKDNAKQFLNLLP